MSPLLKRPGSLIRFSVTFSIAMQAGQTGFKRRGHYLFRSLFPTSRQGNVCRIPALCVMLVFALPALAQDQAGEVIEEITVIGSHIKTNPEEALTGHKHRSGGITLPGVAHCTGYDPQPAVQPGRGR